MAGAPAVASAGNGGTPGASGTGPAGSAGAPAASGSAGTGTAGLPGAAGGIGTEAVCPAAVPEPLGPGLGRVRLPLVLRAGSDVYAPGAVATDPTGLDYKLVKVAFYLSRVALLAADGTRVPTRVLAGTTPRPYDLLLFDSDLPESQVLELAAPPGQYSGLELGIGVPSACNHVDATLAQYPLDVSTGMYWEWATGYIFVRIEGSWLSEPGSITTHIGFDEYYRTARLTGPLTVSLDGIDGPRLELALNEIMPLLEPAVATDPTGLAVIDELAAQGTLALAP